MGTFEKLIERILKKQSVSYSEAEKVLLSLGFLVKSRGSHHVFRKVGYTNNITLKKRAQLLEYQIVMLMEVLKNHGY